jgi:N-acetylglutamate synthase-like GNAT family acetyltransferase
MDWNAEPAIREAHAGDAPQMAALLTQLGYPSTSADVSRRLAYWLPDPMSLILVAVHSGQLVGCLSLHAIPYLERTGRWARIESLVVDQASRGRGTGRSLLLAAEAAASRWDCRAVEVTSLRTRIDAHAFYQRMGYADVCATSGRFFKQLDDPGVRSSGPAPGLRP